MPSKRVAVIGAGPSGIIAIKCLKEERIDPVCFEKSKYFGGLWRFHDDDVEGSASVMKTTIINSSKEMGAFSDFPPPDYMASYMHNTEIIRYFTLYAEHFDLLKHVQYQMEVVKVDVAPDYDSTGKLVVRVKNTQTLEESEDIFDGVFVCIGHHVYPKIPTFSGQEKFQGRILHTHSLKTVANFADQAVAVVGVGNSGMDAAVELSAVSKQVYLSTRKGAWVTPRVGPTGLPFDSIHTTRFKNFLRSFLPYNLSCWFGETLLNRWFDHAMYGLKPNHRIFGQHVTVSDMLPVKLLAGTIKIKKDLITFTEDGILFEQDAQPTKLDAVVLATGYDIKFPFLSSTLTSAKNNKVRMFKYVFPHGLKHDTLAMIGVIQPIGSIFPCCESQMRLASLVLNKKVTLPSIEERENDIRLKEEAMRKRYISSERHTIQVDYIPYLDELNELIGTKPDLWKLAITDPVLWFNLLFGPSLPYQYRLTGPHAWPKARKTILDFHRRIVKPFHEHGHSRSDEIDNTLITVVFFILCAVLSIWIML